MSAALRSLAPTANARPTCRLCTGTLDAGADPTRRLCSSCVTRPEAAKASAPAPLAEAFTPAECRLVQTLHRQVPIADLLRLLNLRRVADLGPTAPRHSVATLEAEIRRHAAATPTSDWSGLRRVIGDARRSGVLARVTPQVLEDFAIVFSLTPAQILHLKDVITHAQEGR